VTPLARNVAAWASDPGLGFGTDVNAAFSIFHLADGRAAMLTTPDRPLDYHELLPIADGHHLLLASPLRAGVDLRPVGFGREETIVECLIDEVDANGRLVWRWRAGDHVRVAESLHPIPVTVARQRAYDIYHCNSIDRDQATGDILVSVHNTDAV